jgi:hypothetical protein
LISNFHRSQSQKEKKNFSLFDVRNFRARDGNCFHVNRHSIFREAFNPETILMDVMLPPLEHSLQLQMHFIVNLSAATLSFILHKINRSRVLSSEALSAFFAQACHSPHHDTRTHGASSHLI